MTARTHSLTPATSHGRGVDMRPDVLQRLILERNELAERLTKLVQFRESEQFAALPLDDRYLLTLQAEQQASLIVTLNARLTRAGFND